MSIVAIINPVSGAGALGAVASLRTALVRSEAERRGLRAQIHVTSGAGHAHAIAAASAAAGASLVIVWGGDGTLNEAGAALLGSGTAIGLVPAGSGNGLAAALAVPHDPRAALAIAFDGRTRTIDAGMMAGRPFFNIAGIGLDARVAKHFNQRTAGNRGRWPYLALGAREGWRYCASEYRVELDGQPQVLRALVIAFANGQEYGMGARLSPAAELDDGLLDLTMVEERPVLARLWHARHLVTGTLHLAPRVRTARVTTASVEAAQPMEFHVDGEPGLASGRIDVTILPRVLQVRTAL
ncbi:MAG: YegS/Rv2252/BmrU family lipid kinase [Acidobacteriota bacterium]